MGGDRRYADLNEVYEDLEHAAAIHRRLGCPVIDVSELSIEEIALRVIRAGRAAQAAEPERRMKPKPPVPAWRWTLWMVLLATALVVFYVALRAVLVRAALARLARRVPRAAPPPAEW